MKKNCLSTIYFYSQNFVSRNVGNSIKCKPLARREIKIQVKHSLGKRLYGGQVQNKIGGAHLGHVGIAMHA